MTNVARGRYLFRGYCDVLVYEDRILALRGRSWHALDEATRGDRKLARLFGLRQRSQHDVLSDLVEEDQTRARLVAGTALDDLRADPTLVHDIPTADVRSALLRRRRFDYALDLRLRDTQRVRFTWLKRAPRWYPLAHPDYDEVKTALERVLGPRLQD